MTHDIYTTCKWVVKANKHILVTYQDMNFLKHYKVVYIIYTYICTCSCSTKYKLVSCFPYDYHIKLHVAPFYTFHNRGADAFFSLEICGCSDSL